MLRLFGYFAVVFVVLIVLRSIPVIGAPFRIPIVGLLLTVAVVGFVAERVGTGAVHRRRFQRMRRDLGQVDTPHNRGKLGALLLSQGRCAQAVEHLETAAAGEPQSAEWHYRLGCALLGARRREQAAAALTAAAGIDEEHAYGAVLLRLVEALHASGRHEEALEQVRRFERNHGPTPESAYRRGLAFKTLGRKAEAAASFDDVSRLTAGAARYQRGEARRFALRAFLARVV